MTKTHSVTFKVMKFVTQFLLGCFESFVRFNVMCFCSPISQQIFIVLCRDMYRSTVNFLLNTLMLFIFPQILILCLFSAYYYMMSLSDFRSLFLYEFTLNQNAAETVRKMNQAFGNDSVNESTVRR